jgi:hypothetical protein
MSDDTKTVPADAPAWVQYEAAVGVKCLTCGNEEVGVKAHAVGFDYCRMCFHTGRAAEHLRADQMAWFRAQLPGWDIGIEHTGGGCFWLAFYPAGPRAGYMYAATAGEASLPSSNDEDDHPIRDGWGYVGRYYYDGTTEGDMHEDAEGTTVLDAVEHPGADFWEEYPRFARSEADIVKAIREDWQRITARA